MCERVCARATTGGALSCGCRGPESGARMPEGVAYVRACCPALARVIELACAGLTYDEMARLLGRSRQTVKNQLTQARALFGVPNLVAICALWRTYVPADPAIARAAAAREPLPPLSRIRRVDYRRVAAAARPVPDGEAA